jgi:hypothetical protein
MTKRAFWTALALAPFLLSASNLSLSASRWMTEEEALSWTESDPAIIECVGEAFTVDVIFRWTWMETTTPSGIYISHAKLSGTGVAVGETTGHVWEVDGNAFPQDFIRRDGSSMSMNRAIWLFTPVDGGVKFNYTANFGLRWSGVPWESDLTFERNHYVDESGTVWKNFAQCMGKGTAK